MDKKKVSKKKEAKKKDSLITSTFLNKKGKIVKVADYISQNDCWHLEKEGRWVLTHRAIKQIARVAGISDNYDVEEKILINACVQTSLDDVDYLLDPYLVIEEITNQYIFNDVIDLNEISADEILKINFYHLTYFYLDMDQKNYDLPN